MGTLVEDDVIGHLRTTYGPERFSQGPEEWILRELIDDKRDGVFVDIGAFDAVKWSNTYRLERDLGWSGLAVDALEEFAPSYTQRPRTRFVTAFVGRVNEGTTPLHITPEHPAVSSSDRSFVERFGQAKDVRAVPNRTLRSLLDEANIHRFDLLTMDIELSEPDALTGFPLQQYGPSVVVVESHGKTRQWLINYFHRHGYVVQGRYLLVDPQNLYFAPATQ